MLFRDNLIIRLVLVYRLKETLRFKSKKIVHLAFLHPTFNFLPFKNCVLNKNRSSSTFQQIFHFYFPFISSLTHWREKQKYQVREGTFLIGGGSGPGLRRGGSLVNILQIGEGQTCFLRNRGRVTVFFWQGKNYSMSLS